ncbi:MAG: hypothetical protein NT105_23860 [Verrucomicrobia bacterium]|nr:hypothetical protein [Verrucomicrobiota bacterium]
MFTAAISSQLSALSLPLLTAAPITLDNSTVVTVGMIVAVAAMVKWATDIWANIRPNRSFDDKLVAALTACQGQCSKNLKVATDDIEVIQADRRRNTTDLWKEINGLKETIQTFSNDLNRALGRLEGRAEMLDAVRDVIAKKTKD